MRRAQDRARSATIKSRALGALKLASEARDENVPAKRADFLISVDLVMFFIILIKIISRSYKMYFKNQNFL